MIVVQVGAVCHALTSKRMNTPAERAQTRRHMSRRAFTLVEILVALAIFALMLAIILVPLRLGLNSFNTGNAQAGVQAAASTTTSAMERELRTAVYVFPNAAIPGVSDKAPYDRKDTDNMLHFQSLPYVQVNKPFYDANNPANSLINNLNQISGNNGVCDVATNPTATTAKPVANLSRLDFLVPRMSSNGSVQTPLSPEYYLVSYYARRLDPAQPFDATSNPWVLCRAQMPYSVKVGSSGVVDYAGADGVSNSTYKNVETGAGRYPLSTDCSSAAAKTSFNIASRWLVQDKDGQPLLGATFSNTDKDIAKDVLPATTGSTSSTTRGSDSLLTPQGMALALNTSARPTTTFACEDTNSDGKIDRVTVRLALSNLSGDGQTRRGQPLSVNQGLPQVVSLNNVH